jgi:hypothetical protein
MTVIVSVKINDGVVMAADSAGSMGSGQIYAHANKIAHLCRGLRIGVMSTGAGGIGNESIETLIKDLQRRFGGLEPAYADWKLDPERYTVGQAAERLRAFLFEEKARACPDPTSLQVRLCGYSAGRPLAEVWEVNMAGRTCPPPRQIMDESSFGVLWDGQYEALNRLILGAGFDIGDALCDTAFQSRVLPICRRAWQRTCMPRSRFQRCQSRMQLIWHASSSRPQSALSALPCFFRSRSAGQWKLQLSPNTRAFDGCSGRRCILPASTKAVEPSSWPLQQDHGGPACAPKGAAVIATTANPQQVTLKKLFSLSSITCFCEQGISTRQSCSIIPR